MVIIFIRKAFRKIRKYVYSHCMKTPCKKQTTFNLSSNKVLLHTLLLLFLFNSISAISQNDISNTIKIENNTPLQLTSTCDSLPITFQKVIELTNDPLFTYDLLTYPNGDYLAVGNYGLNGITQQSYLIKYGPTGKIHWAKEYGASYPPDSVIVDWYNYRATVSESMEGGIVLADSSVIIIGQYIYAGEDSNEGYLVKIGFDGELIWSKTIDRPNDFGAARNLVVGINQTENGAIFISGFHGVGDGFIIKINESGQIAYSSQLVPPLPE